MRKILIVEDNAMLSETYAEMLKLEGYDVLEVEATGEGAVDSALLNRPDVIIMDIALEGAMSGIQAAVRINRSMSVPIILISGHSDENTRSMVDAISNSMFMMKPVRFAMLDSLITEALEQLKGSE